MMYSSSPNLIKHFIPINFSKTTLDYQRSPIKMVQPIQQNPLTNKKLQKLQSSPKDFVLIFRNKSSKTFRAKKKVQYQPLLKNMKHIQQIYELSSQRKQKYQNNYVSKQISTQRKKKPSTSVNIRKSYQLKKSQTQQTSRKYISSASGTLRSTYLSWGHHEKENTRQLEKYYNNDDHMETVCSLKIWGSKAPKSQTIDHFKRSSRQNSTQLFMRAVK